MNFGKIRRKKHKWHNRTYRQNSKITQNNNDQRHTLHIYGSHSHNINYRHCNMHLKSLLYYLKYLLPASVLSFVIYLTYYHVFHHKGMLTNNDNNAEIEGMPNNNNNNNNNFTIKIKNFKELLKDIDIQKIKQISKKAYEKHYKYPYYTLDQNKNTIIKAYPESISKRTLNNQLYVVARPNHNIGHAIRQAFLVLDIIDICINYYPNEPLTNFIIENSLDANFIYQLISIAIYFRSGRNGEESSKNAITLPYAKASAKNLMDSLQTLEIPAKQRLINEFKAVMYSIPLREKYYKPEINNDIFSNLESIIYFAHKLDFLRMGYHKVLETTVKSLLPFLENDHVSYLEEKAKKYLRTSGINIGNYASYNDEFFTMAGEKLKQGYIWSSFQGNIEFDTLFHKLYDTYNDEKQIINITKI